MAQLATLEAKMASIEVSLSSANTPRRRKGTSLGGGGGGGSSLSARASPRPPPSAALSVADMHHSQSHYQNGNQSQQLLNQQQQHHQSNHQHHHQQQHQHPAKELRTALQDREAVIQNLRLQLGLGKMPRPLGTAPLEDAERPAAEQQLARLRHDADLKRVQIRNLKLALDKLDITDNIDARIRQAELEYALGREELQMLSLVEEARALQTRMDKARPEANSLYNTIAAGTQLCLQAVQATVGRWAACSKAQSPGMWIEWALDGEGLYRGDRILEVNGAILTCKTREELHKLIGVSGRCQLVVVRKRVAPPPPPPAQQQLVQSQEDNQRLQHRISYLEDQVKELLQTAKDQVPVAAAAAAHAPHVTSISISASPSPTNNASSSSSNSGSGSGSGSGGGEHDKPQIYQRGSYVTTIVGGKPSTPTPSTSTTASTDGGSGSSSGKGNQLQRAHITKTHIKDAMPATQHLNGNGSNGIARTTSSHQLLVDIGRSAMAHTKGLSASKISINSDTTHIKRDRHREARRLDDHGNSQQQQQQQQQQQRRQPQLSEYSAGGDTENHGNVAAANGGSDAQQHRSQRSHRHSEGGAASHYQGFASYARSVEQLNLANGHSDRRKEERLLSALAHNGGGGHHQPQQHHHQHSNGTASSSNGHHHHHRANHHSRHTASDMRSVKSLDFDSDAGAGYAGSSRLEGRGRSEAATSHTERKQREVDYTSEPVAQHRVRPTPPKKPLRLSLQRAQSLQTVEANLAELDRKRAMKRTHKGTSSEMLQFIENNVPFHTASLGRNNYV